MSSARDWPEPVADGVWRVRGGFPGRRFVNVYLLEDASGVTVFDCGIQAMTGHIVAAAERLGGARQIVLGHAHADHRGAAARMRAPILCHPLERADAEGDGGVHYMSTEGFRRDQKVLLGWLLKRWDAGPVDVAATVSDGDEVAGFRVVHIPGHAPGQIALFRESDGVALTSDCFYTMDVETFRYGPPRVPHRGTNHDSEEARASIRRLADLEPTIAWPGHAEPVRGDVRAQLLRAAGDL
jgi:glyoxylase-like metal-dependent hydrolase (beta-lactamase superfamily II)